MLTWNSIMGHRDEYVSLWQALVLFISIRTAHCVLSNDHLVIFIILLLKQTPGGKLLKQRRQSADKYLEKKFSLGALKMNTGRPQEGSPKKSL